MTHKTKIRKHRIYPIPLVKAGPLLGVSAGHLSHVLRGVRKSKRLTRRYEQLVKDKRG